MTSALPTEAAAEPLDYDALYARYLASLVDDLRGFRAAAPGLELWVPDESPLASLRNLLDAASAVGRARLVVRLSEKTLAELAGDRERLLPMARGYGDATLSFDAAGAVLDVCGLDAPRSGTSPIEPGERRAPSIDATPRARSSAAPGDASTLAAREAAALGLYRAALERAAAAPAHRGSLAAAPSHVQLRARAGEAELGLSVDGAHRIVAARFDAREPLVVGLLESLCQLVVGLPVLEAAEHGTLRLERALRAPGPRPVPGIVLPESVHPLFRLARELLRSALGEYRAATGFRDVHSRHDDRPAEAWLRASDAERRSWLGRAIESALCARGIDPSQASIESIRYDVRVELALSLPAGVDAPVTVMELERALRAAVDPRLELYVTERRDRNAKRRLAVLGDDT